MDTICFAVVAFSLSAALSLFFICRTKALSHFHRLSTTRRMDRTPHSTIPRTGGVAIAIAVALSLLILALFSPELCHFICSRFWIVLLASFIIFVTGLVDDFYGLHFTHKLFMQVVATALVVYGGGYRFDAIYLPFLKHSLVLHDWSSVGLTFIWIIGLCNAVNLADGLDGLAGGVSAIGFFVMLVSVLGSGHLALALVYAVFLGAILGFLRHNFYPASIYMGDTGALLIGFMFACLALVPHRADSTTLTLLPVLALAFPVLDTLLSLLRRLLTGKHPFLADRLHLHHRLMDKLKLSPPRTVLLIYLFSAVMGTLAIALHFTQRPMLWVPVLIACAVSSMGAVFVLYADTRFRRRAKRTDLYLHASQPVHVSNERG